MAEEISIRKLPLGEPLAWPVYHESGHLLFARGAMLEEAVIELLREAGIRKVWALNHFKDKAVRFVEQARRREVSVIGLTEHDVVAQPVFGANGSLVVPAGANATPDHASALRLNGTEKIMVRKSAKELRLVQVSRFRREWRRVQRERAAAKRRAEEAEARAAAAAEAARVQATAARRRNAAGETRILRAPVGAAAGATGRPPGVIDGVRAPERGADPCARGLHYALEQSTETLFGALKDARTPDGARIADLSQGYLKAALADPQLLALVTRMKQREDYLFRHTLGVTMLALNAAVALEYDEARRREVALAAFCHDLGMLAVPPEVPAKAGPLAPEEEREIRKHPAYGLKMLQQVEAVDAAIGLVVFQVHERCDGSGYLRGLSGPDIHEHARLIGMADTFDALCHERPYRPALTPARAMELLLRLTSRGQFDKNLIGGFLRCLGLYPAGSWVQLSDGRIAQVQAPDARQFDRPVLRMRTNAAGAAGAASAPGAGATNGAETLALAERTDLSIARALDYDESDKTILAAFPNGRG